MKRGVIRSICSDDRGAIGPMYALSLFALVAIAGVGFDYGRMVTAQSELQNAADQAALAAATQLTGQSDARELAKQAARNYFQNRTRTADDGEGPLIAIPDDGFTFFSDGNANTPATSDADATAVEVSVEPREVFYALTPIVAVLSSGGIQAHARAALKRAACNIPPIMLCLGKNGVLPPIDKGMSLKLRYGSLAPGAFGYLDVEGFDVNDEMGRNRYTNDCRLLPDVEVRTGMLGAQADAMATRFDYYNKYNSYNKIPCNTATGDFCPAQGVRKNFAIANSLPTSVSITSNQSSLTYAQTVAALAAKGVTPSCPASYPGKKPDWIPFENIPLADPTAGSYGMDACFAAGTCEYVGNGDWSAEKTRYFARYLPGLDPNSYSTRYEVYQKELSDPAQYLKQRDLVGFDVTWDTKPKSGIYTHTVSGFYCAYPQPLFATPVNPIPPQPDRRVMPVAIVDNCDQLSGSSTTPHIATYFDVFLLEPPVHSTTEFHGEVIGPALKPGSTTGYQYYARSKPVLIR